MSTIYLVVYEEYDDTCGMVDGKSIIFEKAFKLLNEAQIYMHKMYNEEAERLKAFGMKIESESSENNKASIVYSYHPILTAIKRHINYYIREIELAE